jgi:hypothetical protein
MRSGAIVEIDLGSAQEFGRIGDQAVNAARQAEIADFRLAIVGVQKYIGGLQVTV